MGVTEQLSLTMKLNCWKLFLWTYLFCEGILALRLVSLHIPDSLVLGQRAKMSCSYDLEGDELYSIKWYRDEVEFYRFVPIDRPPSQFFPLEGIKIDVEKSTNGTVVMHDVGYDTTGMFRCEVSADAPSFQTVSAERFLNVHESTDGQISVRCSPQVLLPLLLLLLLLRP